MWGLPVGWIPDNTRFFIRENFYRKRSGHREVGLWGPGACAHRRSRGAGALHLAGGIGSSRIGQGCRSYASWSHYVVGVTPGSQVSAVPGMRRLSLPTRAVLLPVVAEGGDSARTIGTRRKDPVRGRDQDC